MSETRKAYRRACFNCGATDSIRGESSLVSITPVIYRRGENGRQNKSGCSVTLCETCLDTRRDEAAETVRREIAATLRGMKAGF